MAKTTKLTIGRRNISPSVCTTVQQLAQQVAVFQEVLGVGPAEQAGDDPVTLVLYDVNTDQLVTPGGTVTVPGSQNTFSTIAVSGQSDVVADAANDTLTLVAGSNITITTSAAGDSVTIAASGGGASYTGGDGISIDGSNVISVLLGSFNNGLAFDSGELYSTSRFALLKGQVTSSYQPGTGTIELDNLSACIGELPDTYVDASSTISCTTPNAELYVANNTEVYAIATDQSGAHWAIVETLNLSPVLRGYADYTTAGTEEKQMLVHDEGTLKWMSMPTLVLGTTTAAVLDTDATFSLATTGRTVLCGKDPGVNAVTVNNTFEWNIASGGTVLVAKSPTSLTWYCLQAQC